MMKNEVVSQCQATRMNSGLYTAAAEAQLIAFIIRDSTFKSNFLTLFHLDRISLYCGNCTFNGNGLDESASLEPRLPADVQTLMFRDYKVTLHEHFDRKSGLVLKPEAPELLRKKLQR